MSGQPSLPAAPNGAGRWDQRWNVPAVCLGLAAITFAVFGPTLGQKFVYFDDDVYVYDNPVVARGLTLKGIAWAFNGFHAGNWHPLTWLSHMLDCQLYGLNPAGHHLSNVLLHLATVIALFVVLRRMTDALWRSAFVAAVFAVHPLRAESVAWVAERKDVLSGLFFVLTIGAYVRYVRLPWSPFRYGLVLLLFTTGLMCKPMLVTVPLVLLLLDFWPLQRVETVERLVLEKLPLLAFSCASCVVTILAQHKAIYSEGSFSLADRLANALATCAVYLGQMIWPAGLAVFYPYPLEGRPHWQVVLAGTLLAGVSAVAAWQRRKRPWLLMGWLWYLVMLLPVIGIVQVSVQAHADRYTYLPQIGIYLALTWLVAECRVSHAALAGLMTGVLAVLMVCASQQTAYWKDSETLWNHTLTCTTNNNTAEFNLGNALEKMGRRDEAISHFQKALQIKPDYAEAHNNLGYLLLQKGQVDEAISHFQTALQIMPADAEACNNLGLAFGRKGRADEAIGQYQKALEIEPDYAPAYVNLGIAFGRKGKADEAISYFQKALGINPDNARAHIQLGNTLLQEGRVPEAMSQFQEALRIQPDDPVTLNNLAWLLATCHEASMRNGKKAVELAEQAVQLAGGENPFVLRTLAAAYAEAGRFAEAVKTAQRGLQLAGAQSNTELAGQFQSELKLFQAGKPFHTPAPTH